MEGVGQASSFYCTQPDDKGASGKGDLFFTTQPLGTITPSCRDLGGLRHQQAGQMAASVHQHWLISSLLHSFIENTYWITIYLILRTFCYVKVYTI